jgi:lipoprotein-anchoring transpeptidase ErfK/SrfK
MIGLVALGTVAPVATAAAQGHGACRQVRAACESAGFIQGAAREGIGLQVHCVAPIIQARPQPLTARRPLPKVDPQLVADCRAGNSRFGQLLQPGPEAAANEEAPPRPPASMAPEQREQRALFSALPPEDRPETGPAKSLPPQFRRTAVDYRTTEPAGTIIVDTAHTYLYLVLGNGKAMRYGIGVGREGFTWSGAEKVTRMAEWPDWHPPEEMIARQPYLPRFMAGGEGNPLGARALYLGQTLYRIHGTNQPSTIGTFVSSGCIRLTNDDITDLYGRVQVGTRVVVLPSTPPNSVQPMTNARATEPASAPPPKQRPKAVASEKPAATEKPVTAAEKPAAAPAPVAPPQAPAPTAAATPPAHEQEE